MVRTRTGFRLEGIVAICQVCVANLVIPTVTTKVPLERADLYQQNTLCLFGDDDASALRKVGVVVAGHEIDLPLDVCCIDPSVVDVSADTISARSSNGQIGVARKDRQDCVVSLESADERIVRLRAVAATTQSDAGQSEHDGNHRDDALGHNYPSEKSCAHRERILECLLLLYHIHVSL